MSAVIDGEMRWHRADNRAFNYAVLASLLFHAAVLFSFSLRPARAPQAVPGQIVARLAPKPSAPAAAAPQEPPKPRVEEPAPPPPPPQVWPAPQAKPTPLAKAAPKASKPAAVAKPEAVPPAPPVSTTAPAPSPPAPAATASVPGPAAKADPAPAQSSADEGTLAIYRMELMRMARNYKRYPRVAMDNNWEGKVVIRMVIGSNGMISAISIVNSAGHEILDKQALDMIQKAKPRVQIPSALRGKEFTLEIPVIYSLKEPDAG